MKVSSFLKESQFWCCLVSHQDITWNAEWYSRLKLGFHVALIIAELWAHFFRLYFSSVQFSHSVMSNSATPWTAAHQASLSITKSQSLLWVMMPSNHVIPFSSWLQIFPNIRIFSHESVLRIRWPKYWSFSFSISPSNEYSGLISFTMDWLDLLGAQGTLKNLLQHHSSKASILQRSAFYSRTLTSIHDYWKNHSFD